VIHCLREDKRCHHDGDAHVAGYTCAHAVEESILSEGEERPDTLKEVVIYQLMGIGNREKVSITHAKYVNRYGTENTKECQFGGISSHESKEEGADGEEAAENDRRPAIEIHLDHFYVPYIMRST
jgi:hypothetical protein